MGDPGHIRWFSEIGLQQRAEVGGKGGSLGELERAGVRVPAGFVVATGAFEQALALLECDAPLRAPLERLDAHDLAALAAHSQALRRRVEQAPLPAELRQQIETAHARLCGADPQSPVAVRSSATTEDAGDASFAGLQDTYLWVRGIEESVRSIQRCWASLYSAESISYRRTHGFPEQQVAMAVVVQRMVDARSAGVMFTRSPTSGDRSVITIEAAWGLGSAVVGGEVTPDRWVLGKITGEISIRTLSDKAVQHLPRTDGGIEPVPVAAELRGSPSLSDEELQRLRELARRIERHYGRAQDIEWAVDRHSGEIYVLQSRPETVWSNREAAPAARAAENPFAHVMSIFGGRS
jgi:pyruvate,water dikinase